MKPIYFPFTFLSENVFKKIRTFFPQTILFQPTTDRTAEHTEKAANEGLLEIRTPVTGDEEKLRRALREYRMWIEQHKGSESAFFETGLFHGGVAESIPMYSDVSTSQIKSDIKRGGRPPQPQKPDPLFAARLFLLLAQNFDIQNEQLKEDMQNLQSLENKLFSDMRGEEEYAENHTKAPDAVILEDAGLHKTVQRLAAWLKIFEHDPVAPDKNGSGLFITCSRAVLEHIMEICPDYQLVLSTGNISAQNQTFEKILEFQNILKENLTRLSREQTENNLIPFPKMDNTGNGFSTLKIFRFTQKSPFALFKESLKKSDDIFENANFSKFQKTFIGLVDHI